MTTPDNPIISARCPSCGWGVRWRVRRYAVCTIVLLIGGLLVGALTAALSVFAVAAVTLLAGLVAGVIFGQWSAEYLQAREPDVLAIRGVRVVGTVVVAVAVGVAVGLGVARVLG